MGADTIRSAANPLLKRVAAVRRGKEPRVLVLEGERLIDDALRAGLAPEVVLVAEDRAELAERYAGAGARVRLVAPELLARASALASAPGSLALCAAPRARPPQELAARDDALVLVAGVADPANLGALARSAEAAGAAALATLAGGVSPWNERALRGSMGSLLRLPVLEARAPDALARELAALGFRHAAAATRGGESYERFDWSGKLALWIGSETGAAPEVTARFERVSVPMHGAVESLNVAAAATLLLYAAGRHRARAEARRDR
jgi:TrmH family RNA methyltransferase